MGPSTHERVKHESATRALGPDDALVNESTGEGYEIVREMGVCPICAACRGD